MIKTMLSIILTSMALYTGLLLNHWFGPHPNLDYNPNRSHHRPDGFVNRYMARAKPPDMGKWQRERWKAGYPKPPAAPITGVTPNISLIHANTTNIRVTWVGHSTILLQIDGINLLTDPHFSDRASPVSFLGPKRHQPPGIALHDLPPIRGVLISHNHYDHLDEYSIQQLINQNPDIQFYVPLGVQHWFKRNIKGAILSGNDRNVTAFDWDDQIQINGKTAPIHLHFLAVQHWSARTLFDRYQTLWGSWAILHPHFRFWFSGDLGYSPDTAVIGKSFGKFDMAAIAIGAYLPRWVMASSHITPDEAIQVMKDVNAKESIGIHWGTFELADESLDQPPKDLKEALKSHHPTPNFRVLKHGQTVLVHGSPPIISTVP